MLTGASKCCRSICSRSKNKDRVIGHLMKVKSKNFARIVISFLRADAVNLTTLKINETAPKKAQGKEMEIPCRIKTTDSKQMLNKLNETF